MNQFLTFFIAGSLVRVVLRDATGEILRVFSPAGFTLTDKTVNRAVFLARQAWESRADCFCA